MDFDLDMVTLRPEVAEWFKKLKLRLRKPLKILFVVDGSVGLTGGFGVGRVIDLLRATQRGWVQFDVDLAVREGPVAAVANPAGHNPHFTGFRFDRTEANGTPTLHKYHQVWCFGFRPGNDGSSSDNNINNDPLRLLPNERAVLLDWMNTRMGGVFATGDHHYLGASLASRIPRIGTMRRWTNAQAVPPIGGEDRIDCHRPGNAAQEAPGFATMTGSETDAVPQPIEWVAWMRSLLWKSPHPLLCHPSLGPIDVMPDHNHEGRCFDTAPGRFEVDISDAAEYPTVGGVRPLPRVIAYGNTLSDPPYNFIKDTHPAKRFPMISVYDGQGIGIGRVVTDSTWHHWMDLNLAGIEAAATAAGASALAQARWEKIRRYYTNIAEWLATPAQRKCMLRYHLVKAHFEWVGAQEFGRRVSRVDLGVAMSRHLHRLYGPCWVRAFVLDLTLELNPRLHRIFEQHYVVPVLPGKRPPRPEPDPCLSCPPWDLVEAHVLGGIVEASMDLLAPVQRQLDEKLLISLAADEDAEEKMLLAGARAGLADLNKAFQADLRRLRPLGAALREMAA